MLKYNAEDIKSVKSDIELSEKDRAILASAVKQEWFDIVQRLFEAEIRKFSVKHFNAEPGTPEAFASHCQARAAAQLYIGVMERISAECEIEYYNNSAAEEKPPVNEMEISELA